MLSFIEYAFCTRHYVVILSHKSICVRFSVAQSRPTLCASVDCSPPGSSVRGILQAGILEWVAISFSRESSRPRSQTWVSCIAGRLCAHSVPAEL